MINLSLLRFFTLNDHQQQNSALDNVVTGGCLIYVASKVFSNKELDGFSKLLIAAKLYQFVIKLLDNEMDIDNNHHPSR